MKKKLKTILKISLALLVVFLLYVAGVLIYGTITDWSPPEITTLNTEKQISTLDQDTLTFMSWNIGFGALGEETSFFYDGGETVIQDLDLVNKNLDGISEVLTNNPVDFYLLQEVDSCSKRSHRMNQIERFQQLKPSYEGQFAMNYNVDFVPLPITEPMGKTTSGLLSLSKYDVKKATRVSLDTQFEWPRRVFFLDRCFLIQEVPLSNGKKLIVINTHCSAYDVKGTLVESEVLKISKFAEEEFIKGNYVVIGGDWNQCPPEYQKKSSGFKYNEYNLTQDQIPEGWSWIADTSIPTNRKLETVYTEDSYTSCIDHYLVSPNVQVLEIQTVQTHFQYSDHQPVILKIKI